MEKVRNASERGPQPLLTTRTLTARSVVASTLLGASPPQLPIRTIVRCGALFGFGDGAVRTAVSRMVADGSLDVDTDKGVYRLGAPLRRRHRRQTESRSAARLDWDGTWTQAVVTTTGRTATRRSALRTAARTLRFAGLRQGVWMRPNNLDPSRHPEATAEVDRQCVWLRAEPAGDPAALADTLWDLDDWSGTAHMLAGRLNAHHANLDAGDPASLADGFVLSAAVLRHLLADPLLPDELVPPGWPGAALRAVYDDYDTVYKLRWAQWFAGQT